MLPVLIGRLNASRRLANLLPSCSRMLGQLQQASAAHAEAAALPLVLPSSSTVTPAPVGRSSLVVQYPFEIEYYTPRRTVLYNLEKQPIASVELPGDIFNVPVRIDIINEVIRWQRAKARQGTHKAKDRSEVSGGGRKPWQQKGSGKARQGSIRAPQWRGGGVAHGPVPRSYAYALPKKVRRLGLKCALSAKANEGRLILVDSLTPNSPRTKLLFAKLQMLLEGQPRMSVLLMDSDKLGDDGGRPLRRAAGNIPGVEVVPAVGANVYSIVRRDVLVLTKPAADVIVERLRRPINRLGTAGLAFQQKLQQRQQVPRHQQRQQRQQHQDMTGGEGLVLQQATAVAPASGSWCF